MTRNRGSGGRMTLLLAILFGLVAAGLVVYAVQLARPTDAAPIQMAAVIVARQAIPARTAITADMLEERRIPVEARHTQAISNRQEAIGKVTRAALVPGEQVLSTRLFNQRQEVGLAFMIPDNRRAVSVEVTEVIGSGGLINPGDRVDVIGVCKTRVEANSQPTTNTASADPRFRVAGDIGKAVTALQNLTVLAVAQRLEGEEDSVHLVQQATGQHRTGNQAPDAQPKARSVTLAVTPAEAQRLVLYAEMCKLRLALRPAGDTSIVDVRSEELYYELIRP